MSTKFLIPGLSALALLSATASADVLITEVVDGTLTGGLPKWVELTNTGATPVDLAGYSIGNYNNGGTDLGGGQSAILSGTLNPGESYVINYDSGDAPGMSTFLTVYGVEPSNYDLGAFINGDDCLALFLADGGGPNGEATGDGSDATMVDVYGVIGVDGSGTTWEYTDSYAQRCNNTANGGVFDESQWFIAGADALEAGCSGDDTCETINHQMLTFPFSHPDCGGTPGTAYCFGDGSGTACPCGNAGGAGEGCANSTGSGAVLSASGTTSVSAGDLVLDGANVLPSQPGLFFQGETAINGGAGMVFGDGLRCAGTNVIRLQTLTPGAGGTASTTIDIPALTGVSAGDTRYYQLWYRDPIGGPCGSGFNLTNGLEITWDA